MLWGGRQTLGSLSLTRFKGAYVRQIPGPWPPVAEGEDGQPMVLGAWMAPFMLAKEREQAALGMLLEWHAQGIPLLNPPALTGFAQNKPFQLHRARALGIPHPRTCMTNNPAVALEFIQKTGRTIAKPLHGGALTVALTPEALKNPAVRKHLQNIRHAPVILQEHVDGDDVRLMMLDGKILSCAAIRLPEGPVLDFRGSDTYQGGQATYEAVTLSAETRRQAAAWVKSSGLVLAGVDLKRTARGRMVFLECNSSPIYLDQEWKTGDGISRGIARWLTGLS